MKTMSGEVKDVKENVYVCQSRRRKTLTAVANLRDGHMGGGSFGRQEE